jgi:Trp operon repressor
MTEPQVQIVDAMRELVDANRGARDVMFAGEQALLRGIQMIEAGTSVADTLRSTAAGQQRQATQDALSRVVAARHQLRLRVIAECLSDDMTPREIATAWGFSRQRAARYIQELKAAAPETVGIP